MSAKVLAKVFLNYRLNLLPKFQTNIKSLVGIA